MRFITKVKFGLFALILFAATILPSGLTPAAHAAERRYVCADTLWVRDQHMVVQWTLNRGDAFDVYRGTDNYTVYGFAYGGYNHTGYVYPQYLC